MANIRTDKKNISMNGYNLHIIANAIDARTLSGGDRILIELSKQWAYKGLNIIIHTNKNGHILCQTQGLYRSNIKIDYFHSFFVNSPFLPVAYLARVMRGTFRALRVNYHSNCLVYSSSDFWPDSLPAFIMKLRNKNIKWIAGFYLFAPKIWQKDSPYKGKRWFTGLFYWLTQLPVYWIVKKFADMVFVTSEPDVEKFVTKKRERDKILVIRGGVDTDPSEKYLNCEEVIPVEERKYDAVFIDYGFIDNCHTATDWNLDIIKEYHKKNIPLVWCGGLGEYNRYNNDARSMFPKKKYVHNLPSCGIGFQEILLVLQELFEND